MPPFVFSTLCTTCGQRSLQFFVEDGKYVGGNGGPWEVAEDGTLEERPGTMRRPCRP